MRLELVRFGIGDRSTLGVLLDEDGKRLCYTLEDRLRSGPKVAGETAIPDGLYRLKLQRAGRLHERYAQRFAGMHDGMLLVEGVPGFEGVMLHVGNDAGDTAGCPLVGSFPIVEEQDFEVGASTQAYRRVYPAIRDELRAGRVVELRVRTRMEGAT